MWYITRLTIIAMSNVMFKLSILYPDKYERTIADDGIDLLFEVTPEEYKQVHESTEPEMLYKNLWVLYYTLMDYHEITSEQAPNMICTFLSCAINVLFNNDDTDVMKQGLHTEVTLYPPSEQHLCDMLCIDLDIVERHYDITYNVEMLTKLNKTDDCDIMGHTIATCTAYRKQSIKPATEQTHLYIIIQIFLLVKRKLAELNSKE